MILTPLQILHNNVGDLDKIIVATCFEWLASAKNCQIWSQHSRQTHQSWVLKSVRVYSYLITMMSKAFKKISNRLRKLMFLMDFKSIGTLRRTSGSLSLIFILMTLRVGEAVCNNS